jgi:hypothetical protein
MDISSRISHLIKDRQMVKTILMTTDILAFLLANAAIWVFVGAILGWGITLTVISIITVIFTFCVYYGWIGEFSSLLIRKEKDGNFSETPTSKTGLKNTNQNGGSKKTIDSWDVIVLLVLAFRILVMSVFRYLFIVVLIWAVFIGIYVVLLGHSGGTGPRLIFEVLTVFGILSGLFDIYVSGEKNSHEKAMKGYMEEFMRTIVINCSFLQFYTFICKTDEAFANKIREEHEREKGIFKVHLGATPRTQNKDKVTFNFSIRTSGSNNINFYPIELEATGNPLGDYIQLISGLCKRIEGIELKKSKKEEQELNTLTEEIVNFLQFFEDFVSSKTDQIKAEGKECMEAINKLSLRRIYFIQDIVLDTSSINPGLFNQERNRKEEKDKLAKELKEKMYNEAYVLSLWQDILIRQFSRLLILNSENTLGLVKATVE